MTNKKEIIGITLDKNTKSKVDRFGDARGLSRSAVIRLAVNEFFLKQEGNH